MLCERGGMCDVVKVLDFGLVKTDGPMDSAKLTRANALTGTPLYLPPEAATDPGSVDARSDLYALGAVAYFMLTGRPVFTGRSVIEIVTQHMTAKPSRPSEIEANVPQDLENVVLACLEKTPDKRPESARVLSERLATCAAAGQWTQEVARQWWAEHRSQVMLRLGGDPSPKTKTMTVAIKPGTGTSAREAKSGTA
jgi:serine/threonine protein kinase